jgi:hypothetical protein
MSTSRKAAADLKMPIGAGLPRGRRAALVVVGLLFMAAMALLLAVTTDRSLSLAQVSAPASSLDAAVRGRHPVRAAHGSRAKHPVAAGSATVLKAKVPRAISALDRAKELKERTEWLDSEEARLQDQEKRIAATKAKYDAEYQAALATAAGGAPTAKSAPVEDVKPASTAQAPAQRGAAAGQQAASSSAPTLSAAPLTKEAKDKTGYIHWHPAMGTDISFIPTADFPKVMSRVQVREEIERIVHPAQAQKLALQPARAPKGFIKAAKAAKFADVVSKAKKTQQVADGNHAGSHSSASPAKASPAKSQAKAKADASSAAPSFMASLAKFLTGEFDTTPAEKAAKRVKEHKGSAAPRPAALKPTAGQMKALNDYGMDDDGEPGDAVWEHPEHMGSPCSVAGHCNHGEFHLQDAEHWFNHRRQRFVDEANEESGDATDAAGAAEGDEEGAEEEGGDAGADMDQWPGETADEDHSAEGDSAGEEEPAATEEPKAESASRVAEAAARAKLGVRQIGMSLDDVVPVEDMDTHNSLTSGQYGFDHFGHLPPASGANREIMYGSLWRQLAGERNSGVLRPLVGDPKFGGSQDDVVPIEKASPPFPGYDPDHFADWPHDSAKNMRLLHGAYWRELKRDGVLDRHTPAREAFAQRMGTSHDRLPFDVMMGAGHYHGLGRVSTEEAQQETAGDAWRRRVFTGTDEVLEDGKGTPRSGTTYFKQHRAAMLHRAGPLADFAVAGGAGGAGGAATSGGGLGDFAVGRAPAGKSSGVGKMEAAMKAAVNTLKPVAAKRVAAKPALAPLVAVKAHRLSMRVANGLTTAPRPAKTQEPPSQSKAAPAPAQGALQGAQAAGLGALKGFSAHAAGHARAGPSSSAYGM